MEVLEWRANSEGHTLSSTRVGGIDRRKNPGPGLSGLDSAIVLSNLMTQRRIGSQPSDGPRHLLIGTDEKTFDAFADEFGDSGLASGHDGQSRSAGLQRRQAERFLH